MVPVNLLANQTNVRWGGLVSTGVNTGYERGETASSGTFLTLMTGQAVPDSLQAVAEISSEPRGSRQTRRGESPYETGNGAGLSVGRPTASGA